MGALTEAIKTVCSDNGCMNVFRGGSLELDGVICRFVCLVFFMFPYCIITFYSLTYFEGEVLKKKVQWRFLNIPPYTRFEIFIFFFQDSCGAALSLDKNRI